MQSEKTAMLEIRTAEGLCLLWHRVVRSLIESYPAASRPSDNPLGLLEAELEAAIEEDPLRDLPEGAEREEATPVHTENA